LENWLKAVTEPPSAQSEERRTAAEYIITLAARMDVQSVDKKEEEAAEGRVEEIFDAEAFVLGKNCVASPLRLLLDD